MATDHYSTLINQTIELVIYSEGGITWSDVENMSADELPYVIYNLKKFYDEKQKGRQDLIKSIFEYANKFLDTFIKIFVKSRGDSRGG